MHFRICLLCVGVSSLWLLLSAGIAWGYLSAQTFLLPTALLMGATVASIAYQRASLRWKISVIIFGIPLAYILVNNLSPSVVVAEFTLLLIIGFALFFRKNESSASGRIRDLEEKMKQCC